MSRFLRRCGSVRSNGGESLDSCENGCRPYCSQVWFASRRTLRRLQKFLLVDPQMLELGSC